MKINIKSNSPFSQTLIRTFMMCTISVALNLLCFFAAQSLGIPLYFNSAGTILASVTGGYVPGILVAFATNMFIGITNKSLVYFTTVNIAIALVTAFLKDRGFFKTPLRSYLSAPVLALASGLLGTALSVSVPMLMEYDKSLSIHPYISAFIENRTAVRIVATAVTEFVDKLAVITVYLIVSRIIPQKLTRAFVNGGLLQTPVDTLGVDVIKKRKNRIISLRLKMVIVITVSVMFIATASAAISSNIFRDSTIQTNENIVKGIASLAADRIDGDRIGEFIEYGEEAPGYKEIKDYLYSLRDSYEDVEYIYVYKIMADGCHVVFDLDSVDTKASMPGDIIPFDPTFYPYFSQLMSGEQIEPIISDDAYGWLMSAYVPIYDSYGVCRAYAAADMKMSKLSTYGYDFLIRLFALLSGFFVLIMAVTIWVVENNVILPLSTISTTATAFTHKTDYRRHEIVELIKKLGIHTGDEIENLYAAFVSTMSETVQYIDDIEAKNEAISKMQSGLITVLADMVESRDQCTGDHIQKTVAYVKAILDQMQRQGMYADEITDEFISDVVNAAPLHDIGKIHISDLILNKPGKLTDEEFEIMKGHTTFGSEIIKKAIAIVPDAGYLETARNVAEYHHEKWNGKGYPHGLSGEDIPLSARVMAVADVFDALVSRRSYKEPFTFEKAISIIKEDAGTHFDPLVAEAFLSIEDEVRKIAQEQSDI